MRNRDNGFESRESGFSNRDAGIGNRDMGMGSRDTGIGHHDTGIISELSSAPPEHMHHQTVSPLEASTSPPIPAKSAMRKSTDLQRPPPITESRVTPPGSPTRTGQNFSYPSRAVPGTSGDSSSSGGTLQNLKLAAQGIHVSFSHIHLPVSFNSGQKNWLTI